MIRRLAAVAFLVLVALGWLAAPASADELVVDGTSVDATGTADGYTAKIALLNPGRASVTLDPDAVEGPDGCAVQIEGGRVAGQATGSVTLTLGKSCFEDVDELKVDLDGDESMPAVTIKKPAEESNWLPLWISAGAGLAAALLVALVGDTMVTTIDRENKAKVATGQEALDRAAAYDRVRTRVDARVGALGLGVTLPWEPALPPPADFETDSEVLGLEAGWSFQDSWAANLTVATTAVVALVTSADTLTALLGDEPKAAIGVMTVAGLVSAAVIAVANTVAKLVGDSTAVVTVRGLILSTSLVVFAAGLQVGTVGGSALTLVDGWLPRTLVALLTAALAVVLLWYAFGSLQTTLSAGAPGSPVPVVPDDAFDAWDATEDWEKGVVLDRIEKTYAAWLAQPAAAVGMAYPRGPEMLPTSPGDEPLPRRKASLI
ncbi:hypothetical protein [Marmoricola sp. RAF53]|uniref:hypothetical protein n=1 Tax=Marmoricola sp. RAF53 TaxID=3233059 RepID=UPI003F9D6B80